MSTNFALHDYNKKILYEDECIIVIYKPGKSNFVLCTFSDSISLADGDKIYAEPVISKLEYSAVGFMAKERNWFPYGSMIKGIECANSILRDFDDVVLYGGSMGGYAAIKYSKMLSAKYTIACCPQWSIDPGECRGNKSGYEKHFRDDLKGMGIRESDISGTIYILYDNKHKVDSYHFNKISAHSADINGITIPYVGHHVTTVMAGTENLRQMIHCIMLNDLDGFKRLTNAIRKKSPLRLDYLMKSTVWKHPYLCAEILLSKDNLSELSRKVLSAAIEKLTDNLELQKILKLAKKSKLRTSNQDFSMMDDAVYSISKKILRDIGSVYTHHQTLVVYDVLSRMLKHVNNEYIGIDMATSVIASLSDFNHKAYLTVPFRGTSFLVEYDGFSYRANKEAKESNVSASCIQVTRNDNESLNFICNNLYMSAERGGVISLNRSKAKEWESFYFRK